MLRASEQTHEIPLVTKFASPHYYNFASVVAGLQGLVRSLRLVTVIVYCRDYYERLWYSNFVLVTPLKIIVF